MAPARNTTRCDSAFCVLASVSSASSRCCAAIICCSRMKEAIVMAAMIRSAIQYALLMSRISFRELVLTGCCCNNGCLG